MEFSGRKIATIDEKGRVLLPAEFKNMMGGTIPGDQLAVQIDPYEKCLNIYPIDTWNVYFGAIKAKLNRNNMEQSRLLDMLYSNFKVIQVPDSGRMNLPNDFLEKVNITRDVIFTGQDDRIRLWDLEVHKVYDGRGDYGSLFTKYIGNPEV